MAPRAIFIGPMGSGKTTIGKAVANSLGVTFRDTDTIIEEIEDMPVSQIFIDKGEDYFRNIEKKVLRDELLTFFLVPFLELFLELFLVRRFPPVSGLFIVTQVTVLPSFFV